MFKYGKQCRTTIFFYLGSLWNIKVFTSCLIWFVISFLVLWARLEKPPMPQAPVACAIRSAKEARSYRHLASPANTLLIVVTSSGVWPSAPLCRRNRAAVLTSSGIGLSLARTSCYWPQASTMVASRSGMFTLVRKHCIYYNRSPLMTYYFFIRLHSNLI